MYIGGTDERALHHLFAEVLDNAMDEAVAGHAKLDRGQAGRRRRADASRDDGRGIPVDPHPKHPDKSALEVIITVLHSGGKFTSKAYETSGGLHGVGVSVVNALVGGAGRHASGATASSGSRAFARGKPLGPIQKLGPPSNKKRHPDPLPARPGDLRRGRGLQAGAPLPDGPSPRPICSAASRSAGPARRRAIQDATPAEAVFHFPNGLADFLTERIGAVETVTPEPFAGRIDRTGDERRRWSGP